MKTFMLILLFIAIISFVYSLIYLLFWERITTKKRLDRSSKTYETSYETSDYDRQEKNGQRLTKLFKRVFLRKDYLEKTRQKLARAAVVLKPEEFFMISLLFGLIFIIILYFLLDSMILSLIGFPIGYYLPKMIITSMGNKRSIKLNEQLPEALNLMSNGIRAGYSFNQAMLAVSKELEAPISEEFYRVIRDNSFGKPIEEALLDLSNRTNDEDVDMFVTALIIQRQVGGNLAETLDMISTTIRERIKLMGDIKVMTTQGKVSGVVISLLPVGVAAAILLMNPSYIIDMIYHPLGVMLLLFAVAMQLLGILFLKKIVTLDF